MQGKGLLFFVVGILLAGFLGALACLDVENYLEPGGKGSGPCDLPGGKYHSVAGKVDVLPCAEEGLDIAVEQLYATEDLMTYLLIGDIEGANGENEDEYYFRYEGLQENTCHVSLTPGEEFRVWTRFDECRREFTFSIVDSVDPGAEPICRVSITIEEDCPPEE